MSDIRVPAVRLDGSTQRFGDIVANDGGDLTLETWTVHALVGESLLLGARMRFNSQRHPRSCSFAVGCLTGVCSRLIVTYVRKGSMATAETTGHSETTALCRTRYDPTQPEPVSTTIIEALAAAEGVDPTELEICLHEYLDLDVVDDLMDTTPTTTCWQMELTIERYTIRLAANGEVVIGHQE